MKHILTVLTLSLITALSLAAAPKTILVIESYSKEYVWDANYKAALQDNLGKDYTLVFYEMDTKRQPKTEHQKMADGAWAKYLETKPALVILGDDAALKFLGSKFAAEVIPVVFLGINANPRTYLKELPPNMTGILERPVIKRSIINVSEILPKARKGLILFDTDLTAQATKTEVFGGKDKQTVQDIEVDIRMIDTLADWKAAVAAAKGQYDFIITGLYQTIKDASGATVNPDEVITWTSANTSLPLFAFWDFSVGADKAIGGSVLFGRDMGVLASDMVKKILAGTAPAKLPVLSDTQGLFLFSKTQLDKWRITLPEDILKKAKIID